MSELLFSDKNGHYQTPAITAVLNGIVLYFQIFEGLHVIYILDVDSTSTNKVSECFYLLYMNVVHHAAQKTSSPGILPLVHDYSSAYNTEDQ